MAHVVCGARVYYGNQILFMPQSFLSVSTVPIFFTVLLRFVRSVKCSSVVNNKLVPEPTFLLSVRTHLWEMSFMVLLVWEEHYGNQILIPASGAPVFWSLSLASGPIWLILAWDYAQTRSKFVGCVSVQFSKKNLSCLSSQQIAQNMMFR